VPVSWRGAVGTSAADDLVLGGQVVGHALHELVQSYTTRVHTLCKKIHTRQMRIRGSSLPQID
jgi:hypothetical protein